MPFPAPPPGTSHVPTRPGTVVAALALAVGLGLGIAGGAAGQEDLHLDSLGHDYGAPDAPVQVIEFSDFGCHFCREFHLESFPALIREYVESGKVRWKYVTFVSGQFPNSKAASLHAECVAAQGLFEPMRDRLFAEQETWRRSADPGPLFLTYALDVGADLEGLEACLANGDAGPVVDDGTRLGFLMGVRGTPTFVVDGFPMMGSLPLDFMRQVLDRRLADAREGSGPGR